jgi:hypothetical protein
LSPRRTDDGVVAVVVAIFSVVAFALAALVVDLGYARDVRRQFQGAADSSALAAAQYLNAHPGATPSDVADIVRGYASANAGIGAADWNGCTDTSALPVAAAPGGCISYDPARKLAQVRLPGRRLPGFFSGAFGGGSATVSAYAQATWGLGNGVGCAVCVLGPAEVGNGQIVASGGGVAVDGNLTVGAGGRVSAVPGEIGVAGTISPGANLTPPGVKIDHFTDPLAAQVIPSAGLYPGPAVAGSGLCRPGNFTTVVGCAAFEAGVYVVVGANVLSGGAALIAAPGALFYFTCGSATIPRPCAAGEAGGSIQVASNGLLTLLGTDYGGRNFAVVYDRNNTAPLRLRGNGTALILGDVYAASATMDLTGNGVLVLDSLVVVGGIASSGDPAALIDNYTGTPQSVQAPHPPSLTK